MNPGAVVDVTLLPAGSPYQITEGKIHNLLADAFISSHGDVTGKEVVSAVAAVSLG